MKFRTNNTWKSVITKNNGNNTSRQLYIGLNGGFGPPTGGLSFFTNFSATGACGTNAIVLNRWYFFAASNIATTNTLYVASSEGGQETIITTGGTGEIDTDSATNPFRVGRFNDANPLWMDGQIDDLRIFSSALDASDIAYLYNSGNGRGRVATTTRRNGNFIGAAW